MRFYLILLLYLTNPVYSQQDTLRYQWPVTPLNASHSLNATFCEFRNTLTSDHFHNGIDIGKADGEPCYAVIDGQVYSIAHDASNSYVRIVTPAGDQWKHITYLHIEPNPALSVGDNVKTGTTILGTIYPGMGHVHLIERELVPAIDINSAEINNIRQAGGITPYDDPYPPQIQRSSLRFFIDGSKIEVPANGLSGNIDFQVKIEEHNGTGSVQTNNGTYLAGYRIWNKDTSQIVFEPADNGTKYRFDRKPTNDYVHRVYVQEIATLSNPVYWLTNGSGADDVNQSRIVVNNYFNASLLDTADYLLEIFSEDTKGNRDREFFNITITDQDVTPPATPEIYYLLNNDSKRSLEIRWKKNTAKDLLGYRLYYSGDNQLSDWQLAADEYQISGNNNVFSLAAPDSFLVTPTQDVYFFKLTAVDSSGNESNPDDVYARSIHSGARSKQKALIVNGFTRHTGSGSWQAATHAFVKSYFDPLNSIDSLVISSCSNEAIEDGLLQLSNFDIVIWFLGDESTDDITFTAAEQQMVKSYLENGGRLFVTGSEIGWDLGRSDGADKDFYNNYLKAAYVYDGNSSMSPARGTTGSVFNGLRLDFGQVYTEDYPDDIDPVNGAQLIMRYNMIRSGNTYRKAGIAYSGTFGNSTDKAQLVYLAFPFESVSSLDQRKNFMTSLLGYFDIITNIWEAPLIYPERITVSRNYPNPFNNSTRFRISLAVKQRVSVKIFDMLGKEVEQIVNDELSAGEHILSWNARRFASGLYLLRIQAGNYSQSNKIILIK